ncbi:MAG: PAS domain-containing protein [Ignavibacteriae bacterium]|nr:PAS domain-containing protein [Ignavibacteriota bacterium]
MSDHAWITEFPAAITVCDAEGVIIAMNRRSIETFEHDGGALLIGRNVLDCHPEPSRTQLTSMLASGEKNVYTIQKNGIRKLIYQSPWYVNGTYAGFVEMSLPLPQTMPHFDRDAPQT